MLKPALQLIRARTAHGSAQSEDGIDSRPPYIGSETLSDKRFDRSYTAPERLSRALSAPLLSRKFSETLHDLPGYFPQSFLTHQAFAEWWRGKSAEHKCQTATVELLLQRIVDMQTQSSGSNLDETNRYLDPFGDPIEGQIEKLCEIGIDAAVWREVNKTLLCKDRALDEIKDALKSGDKYAVDIAVQNAKVLLGGDMSLEHGGSLALSFPRLCRYCCCSPATYVNSVRMRLGYFLLSAFVLLLSCSVGVAIETIFAAFNGVFHPFSSEPMFMVLPLLIILFAMMCDTVCVLFRDACTDPPFGQLQAAVLILMVWLKECCNDERFKCVFVILTIFSIPSIAAFFWHFCDHHYPLSVGMGLLLVPLAMAVLVPVVAPRSKVATWWTCFWTDVMMLWLFEGVPLAGGIWGTYKHRNSADQRGWVGAFLRSYQWGGILSAFVAAVAFRMCNLICAWNSTGIGQLWRQEAKESRQPGEKVRGNLRESYNRFIRKIRYHRVPPGMLHQLYGALFPDFEERRCKVSSFFGNDGLPQTPKTEASGRLSSKSSVEDGHVVGLEDFLAAKAFNHKKVCCYLCFAICLFLVNAAGITVLQHQPSADWVHEWAPLVLPIVFALVVVFTSLALESTMPRIFGATYTWMLALFGILLALLICDAIHNEGWEAKQKPTITNGTKHWSGYPHKYGVCRRRWGHLSALDLAQLAQLAYLGNCTDIEHALALAFPESNAAVFNCTNYNEFPRTVIFDFPPKAGHSNQTRIISYKGTSTPQDVNVDVILWSTIKVFQGLSKIIPVINIMDTDQVQWMIGRAHIPGEVDAEERFWNKSITWLTDQIKGSGHVVLTGHSLGGGVAQVLAARVGLNAMVFSPPGIGYSAVRFGVYKKRPWDQWAASRSSGPPAEFGVQHAKRLVTAVVPDFDEVPRVDLQLGQVQRIECRMKPQHDGFAPNGRLTTCHSLERSMCELWRVCGDEQQRNFSCNEVEFEEGHAPTQWYMPDDVV